MWLLRSDDKKNSRIMIGLFPWFCSNGGSPPTASAVSMARSLENDEGKRNGLRVVLDSYLAGCSTAAFSANVAAWLVDEMGLVGYVGILENAFEVGMFGLWRWRLGFRKFGQCVLDRRWSRHSCLCSYPFPCLPCCPCLC